ncbi:hypothetical protein O6H91_06G039900 [Diphasiastrum complanatum]|uniref:Uncharacterized protein n=1 Tax=Diphasiastrum complanatum TaxID=34168 RepID=A0ACC2DCZ0_DIPCM|nr:hypothetical protein O6H91_06G039900 [Diphasiastrum complanatum]
MRICPSLIHILLMLMLILRRGSTLLSPMLCISFAIFGMSFAYDYLNRTLLFSFHA